MMDYHTSIRQQFIREQSSHALKLQDAIAYLQSVGKHCFTTPLSVRIYKPLHGKPLGVPK